MFTYIDCSIPIMYCNDIKFDSFVNLYRWIAVNYVIS